MLSSFSSQLLAELESLRARDLLRSCPSIERLSPVEVSLNGVSLVSFCSNDYLGMACHPALFEAASSAFSRSGFGASASRLVSGTFPEHLALERSLASFVGAESALLFPSGYQANLGALSALAGPGDLIVADRSVHASLIDAFRLSRAKLAFYPHCDLSHAEKHLRRHGSVARRRILVTESLFSMDGDVAPLSDLSLLAKTWDAVLVVDEAHAIGALGPRGAGLCSSLGIRPDVLIGTLGKALGAAGAFVAGSATLRSFLLNHARSFLFTTALPPPVAAAARASVEILTSEEGDRLRQSLQAAVSSLRTSLAIPIPPAPNSPPILPIILGEASVALAASAHLRASGFFVQAIRPPTVPQGKARLRLTLSAHHNPEQIAALATCLNRLPRPPSPPPPLPRHPQTTGHPIRGLVILGTDTSVGKTTIACALLQLLARAAYRPVPFKPVETGTSPLHPTDAARLREAALRPDIPLDVICPTQLPHPVAPQAAAEAAGITLSVEHILAAADTARAHGSPLIVESAGGLLTPYADHLTSADLASALRLPVLLVARNALGTISQTALSITEILRRSLSFLGVILVHTLPTITPDQASNASLIARLTGHVPLGVFPYLSSDAHSNLATTLEKTVDLSPILSRLPPSAH